MTPGYPLREWNGKHKISVAPSVLVCKDCDRRVPDGSTRCIFCEDGGHLEFVGILGGVERIPLTTSGETTACPVCSYRLFGRDPKETAYCPNCGHRLPVAPAQPVSLYSCPRCGTDTMTSHDGILKCSRCGFAALDLGSGKWMGP